ncbi:serine hydrolase domain-containing protein [Thermodesulfobacteriota bacterium]
MTSQLLNNKKQLHLFSKALLVFLFITGCIYQADADENIPVKSAVYAVQRSDGSLHTYVDLVIGKRFSGTLPDGIDSISVTGPNNALRLEKNDFEYNPLWQAFWCILPGLPKVGTYTFSVTEGKNKGQSIASYTRINKIDLPNTDNFKPARSNILTCKPPVFSWLLVKSDIPLFYQVEIRDSNRKHVYKTEYVHDMALVRLPPDILRPDHAYQWRVRVADGQDWRTLDNRSQSRWVSFSTADQLYICEYRYRPPEQVEGNWEVSSLKEQNINLYRIQEMMHQILSNNLKNIHSILVIKNGRLVLEEYFAGYHCNLKHSVQSVTKSVTSILIGIANEQNGKIILDGKLSSYLPDYKDLISGNEKAEITLYHVLTMRAGLEWNEMHMPTSLYEMIWSRDAIKYVLAQKLVDPPGKRFHYSTGLSTILGRVLKNTTGMNALQYAEKHLFKQLEIQDYFWGTTADGSISTGAALYLRPRDMAKLGYLYLNNGTWQGKRVIPEDWIRESIYPHVKGEKDMVSGTGYGYQWWSGPLKVKDQDINTYYAAGHGGQYIVQIPELDLIIVTTSEWKDNNAGDFRAGSIMENYIVPAVLNVGPKKAIPSFDVEHYRYVTGKYRWKKGRLPLKIFIENGKLFGQTVLFDGRFEMLPAGRELFRCISKDVGNFRIYAHKDKKGKINSLDLVVAFNRIRFQKKKGLFWGN